MASILVRSFVMPLREDPIERESDALHREIAARIRRDPACVAEAAAILARWIERDSPEPHPVMLEWQAVLRQLDPPELADFLESSMPRARRLRASSPFAVLGKS